MCFAINQVFCERHDTVMPHPFLSIGATTDMHVFVVQFSIRVNSRMIENERHYFTDSDDYARVRQSDKVETKIIHTIRSVRVKKG